MRLETIVYDIMFGAVLMSCLLMPPSSDLCSSDEPSKLSWNDSNHDDSTINIVQCIIIIIIIIIIVVVVVTYLRMW